jgi:hypothetical protein
MEYKFNACIACKLCKFDNEVWKTFELSHKLTEFAGEHDWRFTKKVANFGSSLEAFSDPIEKGYKSTKAFKLIYERKHRFPRNSSFQKQQDLFNISQQLRELLHF